MLGEGFIRVLSYREEKKPSEEQSKINGAEGHRGHKGHSGYGSATTTTKTQEERTGKGLHGKIRAPHRDPAGLLIPGRPSTSTDPFPVEYSFNCSLLEHYPDLQVADSGPFLTPKPTATQPLVSPPISVPTPPDPVPDQGYLVMRSGVNISVDVPELRTNSVLNGMLEKKLEEVYLQHLTNNLARCNLSSEHSLLHGLVPPPQPNNQAPESLVVSVGEGAESGDKTMGYFNTSSNFSSSVVLRISEK